MLNAEALIIVLAASVAAITILLLGIVIYEVVKLVKQFFIQRTSLPAINLEIVAQMPVIMNPTLSA